MSRTDHRVSEGMTAREFHRALAVLLGISLSGLLLSVKLPHQHPDGSSSADPGHSCPITKIQRSFSPSVPDAPVLVRYEAVAVGQLLCLRELPRPLLVLRSSAPRAPPALS